jgi:hypothetical protein
MCALCLAACGGNGATSDGGGGGDDGGGKGPDAAMPAAVCTAPMLADVSAPTTTITTCDAATLQAAATVGGVIVFACGSAPVTIPITTTITFTKETVLDGGGLVTLDGGNTARILYLDSDFNTKTPRLTVQRLSFVRGMGPPTGDDTARGGGAIYRDGGSLTVIDCAFDDNHAGATGQDLAGGAIYGFGGGPGETVISGSTFTNNSASDGGAVGSLQGDLTIINSTFANNSATGTGGNPGNGGAGGALYMDGKAEKTSLCGVKIANNTAGNEAGGFFRVSNTHDGSFAMDRTTVDSNTVMNGGNAGGLYLEGLALTVTNSTISRNTAGYNGGMWINTDTVMMTNVTIAENTATVTNGGGLWLGHTPTGTLLNVTIANNHSTAPGNVAGAIFGAGLTLVNTIVANNTAQYTPQCDVKRTDGSGNLQFPNTALCTTAPVIADPMLGALANNGGDTETMVPAPGGPAATIGTGCPATDQLGHPRGNPCTAGAVEAP